MRKQIRQIAAGRFDCEKPSLSIPEELKLSVLEEQEYSGGFTLASTNHTSLRGIVYSTSHRMECLTPQFDGEEVRIRYQFHSRGLVEGDTVEGSFVIVCDQSEHTLSFCVSISRPCADSSMGPIRNLHDFTALAREKWDEAYRLFYHKGFSSIISKAEYKEAMIYKGIVGAKPSPQNMEEFLIGIGRKNPINFRIDQTSCRITELTETSQQTVELRKDEWGYLSISVSSDADFLRLTEERLVSEDFLGSTYPYQYLIDYDRMHAGWNYGRISFSTVYETRYIEVRAHKGAQIQEEENIHQQIREDRAGIMELYQAYRLNRIVTGVWANETIDILNHLHVLDPEEPMYPLMKAQAFLINRQRQEAEWILEDFRRSWHDKKSPVWGYYLYLMTLMEREPAYVDKMTREIEVIFHENPNSVLLFWVLSFLEEEYYNNNAHKLEAVQYWIMKGANTPYLYLEAYYLYCQDPYLLAKLGRFEVKILRWALRRQALNKELAAQIFQVVDMNNGFDPIHYGLLAAAYGIDPRPEYVGVICSYLIRAQRFDKQYHHWFEMGIELELRITSLYEAYLLSFDERGIAPVPKIIQMYFQYKSSLSYRKMAILYNNIIANKEKNPEVYEKYRRIMGRFAMEQIEAEHMDDNLAVLYEDMLDLGFVDGEIAHCLARILFTHKLVVFDSRMVRAIIYQRQLKEPQIVSIVEQSAYFQMYTKDSVILFEDEKGRRYIGSVSYRLQKLMEPERYLTKCMHLAPEELPYLIPYFDKRKSYRRFSPEDQQYFHRMLFTKELSPVYQSQTAMEILRFYRTREDDGDVKAYLEQADFSQMPQTVRRFMLDALVEKRLYEQAYELIQIYGMDQLGAAARVALASAMIGRQEEDSEEADEYLLLLTETSFFQKKYNDTMLGYLCRYYNGPTERMCEIWKAAERFQVDAFELEERILVQMIYGGHDLHEGEAIFESYYNAGGKELVILAFLSASAQAYFVENAPIHPELLRLIKSRYTAHQDLNDACRLALFKSLAEEKEHEPAIEEELLGEYTRRNMYFSFYRKLSRHLIQKYHLYDKTFLEFRAAPRSHVTLHYSRDEDGENFVTEDMPEVYCGIFVKPFVMFFGETIQYYISKENGNQVEVTESRRITNNDVYTAEDESRYGLINQMLISGTLQDESTLYHNMKQYAAFDEATKKLFQII
ncbi:MAG: DUF5717 family protein [Muribaculaceae bacterium]|nr:DUF5717 family protein [Roseburia sp.]MCM1430305.1 DUF5717 family protein [Muribaculaceae bacterium]MCM1492499.1 DUF5717 family protein [Muribaculaceae bacterium]